MALRPLDSTHSPGPSTGRALGLRAGATLVLPTAAIGGTFGLLAEPVVGAVAAVVMSALVWSGTAQFASLSVLAPGGGVGLAGATGLLANTRFVAMGFAIAPSLHTGPWQRVGTGVLLADASFAVAHRSGADFDIAALRWAMPFQYVGWLGGTVAGVLGAGVVDPTVLGLDVLFPVFYLSLLLPELDSARTLGATLLAAGVALALVPVTPTGVPVLAAASTALIGLLPVRRHDAVSDAA
jgi:predicted branched-subunit amino acid permease